MTRNKLRIGSALLIFGLLGGYAVAQTFSRAVQLSQDTSGAFLIDTNNNLYLPKKLMFPTGLPNSGTPSITGTGTPTVAGTDAAGVITMGTSATTATLVFGQAYGAVPNCMVVPQNSATVTPISFIPLTTSIQITQGTGSANKLQYFCTGTTS